MTCPALKIVDQPDPSANPNFADTSTAPNDTPAHESMFETFVDEIDAWARQALAANGFGDY